MKMKNEMRNKSASKGTRKGVMGTYKRGTRATRKNKGIAMKAKGRPAVGKKRSIVDRMEKADYAV